MIIEIGSTARVTGVSEETRKNLFQECAVENPLHKTAKKYSPWGNTRVPEYLYMASLDGDDGIILPRGFGFHEYEDFQNVDVIDSRVSCPTNYPDPLVDLFISQKYVKNKVMEYKDDPQGTFLIVLPTSRGKTITTLLTLADLKERALIIVHTDLIFNAWVKDFNKVFGVPSQEIGVIKRDTWKIGDHITVASMMTLIRRKKKWPDLWKQMGAIVVDECHISPCNTVTSILNECPAKYRIGITATDQRKDGLHKVIYMLFGEPFVRQSVEKADTQSSLQIADAKIIPTDFYAEYGEDYHTFLDELMWDTDRNKLIVDSILKEVRNNKVCLAVTCRRRHADILGTLLEDEGVQADILLGGGDKDETRKVVQQYLDGKKGVIIATNKLISTGANIPPLERLFITVPYANENEIVQLAGRIRRKHPGKEDAIIYAFQDVKIPRVNAIFNKYFFSAFQKMRIPTWEGKYY